MVTVARVQESLRLFSTEARRSGIEQGRICCISPRIFEPRPAGVFSTAGTAVQRCSERTPQRRRYLKTSRKGVLDSDEKLRTALKRIYGAEFEWIILQGEFKALMKCMPEERERTSRA